MNNLLLDLGFIKIYWYSFLICLGAVIGAVLAVKEAKKNNISKDIMLNYFFYLIIIGIIGARLYYVLFNISSYQNNLTDIFKVWEGGLAIHGGIIAGIIFTYFYSKKYNINFFKMTDIAVVSLILAQAIGRWGNFFNQEAYGPVTTYENLRNSHIPGFIIDNMFIGGEYHQPTFFYECVWCLAGFLFMLIIRSYRKLHIGNITAFYMIWYGMGRYYIESLRADSLMLGNIKVAQLVSIISIIVGIVIILVTSLVKKYKINYHTNPK